MPGFNQKTSAAYVDAGSPRSLPTLNVTRKVIQNRLPSVALLFNGMRCFTFKKRIR
jgi:hypothetical protein